jgi:hypothetical protein
VEHLNERESDEDRGKISDGDRGKICDGDSGKICRMSYVADIFFNVGATPIYLVPSQLTLALLIDERLHPHLGQLLEHLGEGRGV